MPAAYAHHRFGEACIENMPPKLQKICRKYREVYDFGIHGPDVLFYYHPLQHNEVNGHGSELHHWTGAQFFEICKYVYGNMAGQLAEQPAKKYAMLSYLMGFLAHFTLDSCCHGYINTIAEESPYSHNLIESQYEAYLMELDGKNPIWVDRSKPLKAVRKNAAVIAEFFPFYEEEILDSMKGQKQTLHLFYSPLQGKKFLIRKAISLLDMKGDFGDLFLDRKKIPECQTFNREIFSCQERAMELYPGLLKELIYFIYDKGELGEYFNYDFEGILHESSR